MDVQAKLQLKPGGSIATIGAPADAPVEGDADPATADLVLAYLHLAAELGDGGPVLAAAKADRLAWFAYPKAGLLGTDLNRDRLAAAVVALGARPVRQVALDGTWSALRFRPA